MSIEASRWATQADVKKSTSKLVLLNLAQLVQYNASEWTVFASIEYLARVTHLNRKTVVEAMGRLRELGVIQDTGRRAGGNRSCILYRLCPDAVPLLTGRLIGGLLAPASPIFRANLIRATWSSTPGQPSKAAGLRRSTPKARPWPTVELATFILAQMKPKSTRQGRPNRRQRPLSRRVPSPYVSHPHQRPSQM